MKQLLIVTLFISGIGCKTVSTFPLAPPLVAITDDGICGTWRVQEDTAKRCKIIITKGGEKKYHVQVMLDNNINPNYEANMFITQLDKAVFINAPCRESTEAPAGYLLMRLFDVDAKFTKMTTCTVNDTTMRKLLNTGSVKSLVARNINNPSFFYDTVHFFKEGPPLQIKQ